MSRTELPQLEILAEVDELVERLARWAEPDSPWEPLNRTRALVRRLLGRVEQLRIRLETPLVVATFGGTGTGKSTLVNALIGQESSAAGRQRPTTTRPVLIVHPNIELESLGLPLDEFDVKQIDVPVLNDIVIIDCPDPDTTEEETPGSNLQRLHQLLPHCDVLIYTSTQQKYRSARVGEELGEAATGCRLLFVQTHADIDDDIRDDWRRQLAQHYEVPEMFFIDSLRALREQRSGRKPTGEFGRLQDLLQSELGTSQRLQIRRANLVDLIDAALQHCRSQLAGQWPAVEQLEAALEEQKQKLITRMADQLGRELHSSRNLWERRILSAVTGNWGFSPFSSMLRFYNGLGDLIASVSLFRARNSAQVALIGALQGARWLRTKRQQQATDERLEHLGSFGLNDDDLREAHLVVSGYVHSARLDPRLADEESVEVLGNRAGTVEDRFLGDAGRKIDAIIDELAEKNSGLFTRAWYEVLFGSYLVFVLFRVGKNFFWDSFLREVLYGSGGDAATLLPMDFYVSAAVIFVLWTGILVISFTRRLRRGLNRRIDALAQELSQTRLACGLFPRLEQTCREIEVRRNQLNALADSTRELRSRIAGSPLLGAKTPSPAASLRDSAS